MNNIHISSYNFLPLIELLYLEDDIREELLFLQDYQKIFNVLEEIVKNKKSRKSLKTLKTFIPTYSNLFWRINNDGYCYYETVKQFLFDNEPIRPLLPLSTKTRRWKELDGENVFVTKIKRIELFPILSAVIEKEVALKETINKNNANRLSKLILKKSREEAKKEKMKILNGLFVSLDKINVRLSDQLVIREHYEEKIKEALGSTNRKNIEKVGSKGTYIVINNPMDISIFYTQKPVTKILRRRLKISILAFYLVKFLRKRVLYILDKFYEEMTLRQKINLLELILVNLNPNNYGMRSAYSLLPQAYQRKTFSFLARKMGEIEGFEEILDKLVEKISNWDLYRQQVLFQNKNIAIEQFKKLLNAKESNLIEKPKLSLKAHECLEYMIKKFLESDDRWIALQANSKEEVKPIGSISRHQLRTEFKKILEEKIRRDYDTAFSDVKVTDRELREKHPKFIKELILEDLVKIHNTNRKTGEYRYHLNYNNLYIKYRIRNAIRN